MKSQINKIAEITLLFWFMKIVATTLGETLGDYLSMTLGLGYDMGIAITLSFFILILFIQVYFNKYVPLIFWLVIIATTTLGTEISDYIDRTLQLGYTGGTFILASLLALILAAWYYKFKNLKVYPIANPTKEIYFWLAVLLSNSLGTAFGDFLGDVGGLSYLQGALVTASIILIILGLHYYTRINEVALFWIAFIFTRPFGATFGDFLTKPMSKGGLDLGTLNATLVAVLVMGGLIYLAHNNLKKSTLLTSMKM